MRTFLRLAMIGAVLAFGAHARAAVAAEDFTITVVNPDDNKPVMNKALRVHARGGKTMILTTDENGKLALPRTLEGKTASIRCSKVPLLFDTRRLLAPNMTVVLKHRCEPHQSVSKTGGGY